MIGNMAYVYRSSSSDAGILECQKEKTEQSGRKREKTGENGRKREKTGENGRNKYFFHCNCHSFLKKCIAGVYRAVFYNRRNKVKEQLFMVYVQAGGDNTARKSRGQEKNPSMLCIK